METIYSEGDEEVQTAINYNVDTDTYSLFEANMNTGELVMVINEKEYTVVVFCKTFLHNIAKKKYTPLRLKFFSDYCGFDRAFLSR